MQKIYLPLLICLFTLQAAAFTSITGAGEIPKDSTENQKKTKKKHYGTEHVFNIDFGTNNYHKNGKFPDEDNASHSVRPWGSWYFALTSLQRSHVAGGLFLEWGGGVSWYNFKFQNSNTTLTEGFDQVEFDQDLSGTLNYEKSKLAVSYINLSLVPVYQFGKNKNENSSKFWKGRNRYNDLGLRIGAGGYVGYRLGSHTKLKYEDERGHTQKVKDHDNFYLENLRYGVRAQIGYKGTDIFVSYDLNNLFSENRGPDLSAVSFGFMF